MVFIVAATVTGQVVGWNDAGHMLMTRLAFEGLSETQRVALEEILRAHPRFEDDFEARTPPEVRAADATREWRFARAATWPDTARHFGYVKSARTREALVEKYNRGPAHYINLELRVDAQGDYRAVRGNASADGENIVRALEQIIDSWATASDAQRAVALCWLLHLMGDLHQPLHTTTLVAPGTLEGGDRGGNEIRIRASRERPVGSGGGRGPRNLHALWDGALGNSTGWAELTDQARGLQRVPQSPSGAEPAEIDFVGWAEQGRALARVLVYVADLRKRVAGQSSRGKTPNYRPDDGYLERMRGRARSQIILAAHRTVRVLDKLSVR